MTRIYPEESWPDSWKYSYAHDLQEIYGGVANRGYAYTSANRRTHVPGESGRA